MFNDKSTRFDKETNFQIKTKQKVIITSFKNVYALKQLNAS